MFIWFSLYSSDDMSVDDSGDEYHPPKDSESHSSDSEIDDSFAERPTRSMPQTMIAQQCDSEQQNSGR